MAFSYYPNNQYYMQNMQDLQNMKDRIDRQMQQIQQQNQVQQQPVQQPITQNFQLAPNPNNNELESKYVNSVDEVKNTFVMKTGVFLNKDFTNLWIKDVTGNIKTYRLEEVIELDPKDKEILMLKRQIEEMKGMINYESNGNSSDNDESNESKKSARVPVRKQSNAK